jgi:amidase
LVYNPNRWRSKVIDRSDSWVGATATQIARAVRRGDASATEVVADHLDYIRDQNGVLRAFRTLRAGEAVAEAETVDEQPDLANLALAGVPIAVKENTAVAGLPTGYGSSAARAPVAETDHEVVRRLRGAGAIVVGTTRMPELGAWGMTDDETGITRNPWRSDRTPGGSSGGAAAAVAAGLVPIAHGNDGLGSIRIPAACCGLVGIKPGRGVVPARLGPTDWFGLAEHGILATTVGDAATGFAVLAGRSPQPLEEPGRLRIAVSSRSPTPAAPPDAGAKAALLRVARLLVGAGHDAVRADPGYPMTMQTRVIAVWFAAVHRDAEAAGVDRRLLQPRTRQHVALGEQAVRRGLIRAEDRAAWRRRCLEWFAAGRYDLLVTPALASAPPAAVGWSRRTWRANMAASVRYAPYAAPWNFAGLPALVLPVGVRPDGMPGSVQLVGPPGAEPTLLNVAAQIERLAPWRRHAPGWPRRAGHRQPA